MLKKNDFWLMEEDWQTLLQFIRSKAGIIASTEIKSGILQHNKNLILLFLHLGWLVELTSEDLKNDRNFILKCVKINGGMLEFASEALKNDSKIARAVTR